MTFSNQDSSILNELKKISKILLLANSTQIDGELGKIADNDARKKIWILIDGKRMPKDIAKEVGISLMTVSRFLDSASAADLVCYMKQKPPLKIFDYVPSSWLNLLYGEEKNGSIENDERVVQTNEQTNEKQSKLLGESSDGAVKNEQ